MRKKIIVLITIFIGLFALLSLGIDALAYVRESDNYRIQSDSINSGGTDESVSNSYKAWDTVGEVGTGESSSDNYGISAGYRQMEESYISLSVSTGNIDLAPEISGLSGGTATGSAVWTVWTDAIAGYSLTIRATGSPALVSGPYDFQDYTPAVGGTPDYNWSLAGANSEFGFSPYNPDGQSAKYMNNDSLCAIGGNVTDEKCWYGLSTSNETVVFKTSRTDTGGEDTKITFRAEVSTSGGFQPAGQYTATIEVTASVN